MFDILRSGDCNYVVQSDLKSMLAGILLSHPGLEFLQDTPEFQDRYAETVILRIFYCLDKSGLGRITLRDLKRCRLPSHGFRSLPAIPLLRHAHPAIYVVLTCHVAVGQGRLVERPAATGQRR